MNKKVIGIFVGILVVIGGLIWLGQPTANQNNGQAISTESLLKINETNYDFGTISMANGKVNHEFIITNSSGQPINIKKIYTSCMCTVANFRFNDKSYGLFGMPGHGVGALAAANITLNSGDFGILDVVYDPNAHGPAGVGAVERFVYVEDKNGSQLKIEIKEVVTP